jgi:hypothetical protein
MKQTFEVMINEKNGKVTIENLGETNYANQFIYRFDNNDRFTGFYCDESKIQSMFTKIKESEIKSREKQIKQLQKEIKIFEKAKIPTIQ